MSESSRLPQEFLGRSVRVAAFGAALLTIVGLGGCDLEWDKPNLGAPPPERFRARTTRSAPPVDGPYDFAVRFGSKELTRLINKALDQNLDIAAEIARIKQADARARVASAAQRPSVSVNNIAQTSRTPGTVLVPASGSSGLTPASGHSLQGQYELQKGRYEELATLYRKQILNALYDVENALVAVRETARQLKLQASAAAAW
jgi:outer membrane protein TolC